jgi:hypothetical protein
LNEGLHRKLTLISAPDGFGKTTLASEWIASGTRPSAWLSLDEEDGDLARFLMYLVAALRTINADVGTRLIAALPSLQQAPVEPILLAKIYEVDALRCSRCGSPMKVLAIITDPPEVRGILLHLIKTGVAPPGLEASWLN